MSVAASAPFRRVVSPALVLTCLLALATCAFAAQTRAWRVGVGGDLSTGFLGALSIYGLPHETILDREMSSAGELAKFQIVFLSRPTYGVAEVNAAVEEYVRNGGCAVYEYPCTPSEAMVAGRRIPPRGPGMVYEGGSPVTAGLTSAIMATDRAGGDVASIIPTDPKATVLVRFTDRDAKPDRLGRFVDGDRGAPAIIMADYGRGKVVWSGVRLSMCTAFDDRRYIAPFIASLVRELSSGEVVPRFSTEADPADTPLTDPQPYRCSLPGYTPREAADTPGNAQALDDDADSVSEFDLSGKIIPGTEASVYLAYHNARWYRAVTFDQRAVSIVRIDGGKVTVLRSVPLPPTLGWRNVWVKRRWGAVTVYADGKPLISACDGMPLHGTVAVSGVLDPGYQPVVPVEFSDDFTRTADETDMWGALAGTWQMVKTEGEPSEAANPFRYQGIATAGKPAVTTTGSWSWDDYCVEASVFPDSAACGVIGHYQGPGRYVLVRLTTPTEGQATLAVVGRTPRGEFELASAPVPCERRRWYRLGLRATAGVSEATLDGKVIASAPGVGLDSGAVGMYVEDGKAQFDDVAVTPWHGTRRPASGWGPWEWSQDGGVWGHNPGAAPGGAVTASAPGGASAFTPDDGYADGVFEAEVKPAAKAEAGLLVRYQGKDSYVRASLAHNPAGKLTALLTRRTKGRDLVLASAPVAGDPRDWHRLQVTATGCAFALQVDGKPCLEAHAAAAEHGAVGLHVQGNGAFRDWAFLPLPNGVDVNDTPTPAYAGIIDRNSWAGRAGAWQSDPTVLNTFWHCGYFPHDVDFRLGVDRGTVPATTTTIMLSPARVPDAGYVLTATQDWNRDSVDLALTRKGQKVAAGTVALAAGAQGYCLSLHREAGVYVAAVNDVRGLAYEDATPLPAPNLGFQVTGGGLVRPDDTRVASADLRNHTFDAAPTDWFISSGTWELTSRWPCTPGWAWFSGVSDGEALVRTKAAFGGDQEVQFYAGAKMLAGGEAMRDIIVGLCGSADPGKGYRFTVEASSGGTYLTKDGQVVARAEGFVLSQATVHFDWTSFAARKEGSKVSLKWWGRTILEYEDPTPLDAGYVWLGTFRNGISIPRVTIYGRQQ